MKIAGLQKLTLIDYPKKVACTIFTLGCNFKCGFCYNPELVLPNNTIKEISEEEIFDFLKKRKKYLDGVCITGGEPTIHKDLPDFIKKIKEMNLLVKLDTNGTNPEIVKKLVDEKLVDYISMDIKTGFSKYSKLTNANVDIGRIEKTIQIIKDSNIDYEFRTTVIPGFYDEEDIKEIKEKLKGAKKYYLQEFLPNKTIKKEFSKLIPYSNFKLEELKRLMEDSFEMCKIR